MFTDRLAADQLADPLIVGRRPGPFGEPTGKRAAWGSVSEYRFRDGVVFEIAFVGDTLSLLKQLGFTSIHPRLEPELAWKRDGLTIKHIKSYAEMHAKYQCPNRPGDP